MKGFLSLIRLFNSPIIRIKEKVIIKFFKCFSNLITR